MTDARDTFVNRTVPSRSSQLRGPDMTTTQYSREHTSIIENIHSEIDNIQEA